MDVVVITGIGGMGEAIARRIGSGKQLLLADFNEQLLASVADKLRGDGFIVETAKVDVSQQASMKALAAQAASLGPVTAAVHTAGLSPAQASAAAIYGVDLAGVGFFLEEFAPVMAPGSAGVVIASMAGWLAAPHLPAELLQALTDLPADQLQAFPALQSEALQNPGTAYSLAKRANQLRVQRASLAWGASGSRVNSISPGVISTPMGQQELNSESGTGMRHMVENSGTGRLGTASDIAQAAAFLLSNDASFITGTDLLVDGGAVAGVSVHGMKI